MTISSGLRGLWNVVLPQWNQFAFPLMSGISQITNVWLAGDENRWRHRHLVRTWDENVKDYMNDCTIKSNYQFIERNWSRRIFSFNDKRRIFISERYWKYKFPDIVKLHTYTFLYDNANNNNCTSFLNQMHLIPL